MSSKKRKICVVINSRPNYSRIKSFLHEAKKSKKLDLHILVGASALLYRFGEVVKVIKKDGFKISQTVYSIVEGENPTTMAKSTGLGIVELSTHFQNLKPDIVLTVADRFETIATAIAASYMNIPVAHTQGGEMTGSIDENVRHAITKLSHIHFPSTKKAKKNLILMGENPSKVFLTGCPSIDLIKNTSLSMNKNILTNKQGVGDKIDLTKEYIILLQHPVTTEFGDGLNQIKQTLEAIGKLKDNVQVIGLWPNPDAGSDDISKGIRIIREQKKNLKMRFFRNFTPEDFLRVLNNSSCVVGNSSAGIRECSFMGVPTVNIGSRQNLRERASNVLDVSYKNDEIYRAINFQRKKRYKKSKLYGDGNAGKKIVKILSTVDLSIKKKLSYRF
jgi:UDP-hydrolysing UDP-N-acetyl-D-glucosamine 2-epimerase